MSVRLHIKSNIGYLTLDAPPRNEMDHSFFERLDVVCRNELPLVAADRAIRGMIVTGAGRHFSSGANISELRESMAADPGLALARLHRNVRVIRALETLPFPVVAAIRGCCLGSGLELALACRRLVAAENAVLGLPETSLGVIPGCGGTIRLPEKVGRSQAVRLILSGRPLLAHEAAEIGLVDAVVRKSELIQQSLKYML